MAMPSSTSSVWTLDLPAGGSFRLGERVLVMGVLNLTPDSFSDGGKWLDAGRAVDHALAMLEEGADLIDLGAESTRPGGGVYGGGAQPVSAEEESARLLPVLRRLRGQTKAPLSVDTRKSRVAEEALDAGADLINDVSALGDPLLGKVVAGWGCPIVLMHSRGELATMQQDIHFEDLLGDVREDLQGAMSRAEAAGIPRHQVLLDPGVGFGKTAEQNLTLLAGLDAFHCLGRPLVVGASRKSFIGHVTGAPAGDRLGGSLAAAAWAASLEAGVVRVHDVSPTVQFLKVWTAIKKAKEPPP